MDTRQRSFRAHHRAVPSPRDRALVPLPSQRKDYFALVLAVTMALAAGLVIFAVLVHR